MAYKNEYTQIPNGRIVPLPSADTKSGTIDAAAGSENITGTATDFQSDVTPGDYLFANNEVRKVISVSQDYNVTGIDATGNYMNAWKNTHNSFNGYLVDWVMKYGNGDFKKAERITKKDYKEVQLII